MKQALHWSEKISVYLALALAMTFVFTMVYATDHPKSTLWPVVHPNLFGLFFWITFFLLLSLPSFIIERRPS